jgi:hypothetical protein
MLRILIGIVTNFYNFSFNNPEQTLDYAVKNHISSNLPDRIRKIKDSEAIRYIVYIDSSGPGITAGTVMNISYA